MKYAAVLAVAVTISSAASGQTLKLLDVKDVDPAMLKDMYGTWEVQDAKGKKRCRVVLRTPSAVRR